MFQVVRLSSSVQAAANSVKEQPAWQQGQNKEIRDNIKNHKIGKFLKDS